MMAYQQYPSQAYDRHSSSNVGRPPHPGAIITNMPSYPAPESYYTVPSNFPNTQHLPPAHILQYLSPPPQHHPSPTSSYPSSASTISRHSISAPGSYGSLSPYSQPSPQPQQTHSQSHTHSQSQYQSHRPPTSRAVIIGINYFNQKGELRQSCRDARNLFNYLTSIKHYSPSNIILLTDDQNGVFGQPTRKNILNALSWVGENAERGEKVVVYYSGHGKVAAQGGKKKSSNKVAKSPSSTTSPSSATSRHSRTNSAGKDDGMSGPMGGMGEQETIYPVDFRSFPKGQITPEEIEERLKPAQRRGVKMTIILDTHAGVA